MHRSNRPAGWTAFGAFVWHRGEFELLPGLSTAQSMAMAISDNGMFVAGGSANNPNGPDQRPVLWSRQ